MYGYCEKNDVKQHKKDTVRMPGIDTMQMKNPRSPALPFSGSNLQNDIRWDKKAKTPDAIQRVLFADIPLNPDNTKDYRGILEMQVWWFMACEHKKRQDLRLDLSNPDEFIKSLRTIGSMGNFDVPAGDRVRLASHGESDGAISIGGAGTPAANIIDTIKSKEILSEGSPHVDADYCYIAKSGLPITREDNPGGVHVQNQGATVSAVGKTLIFPDDDDLLKQLETSMSNFTNAMIAGIGYKYVDEISAGDFPLLHAYLNNTTVAMTPDLLYRILDEVYEKGVEAMNEFTTRITAEYRGLTGKEVESITGIWG